MPADIPAADNLARPVIVLPSAGLRLTDTTPPGELAVPCPPSQIPGRDTSLVTLKYMPAITGESTSSCMCRYDTVAAKRAARLDRGTCAPARGSARSF